MRSLEWLLQRTMKRPRLSRRFVIWAGFFGLIIYALWIGGPYLRSIVVRDAAVTTWINVAAAPIDGTVARPLRIGERIDADGRVFKVDNPRADALSVSRARAEFEQAQMRVTAITGVLAEVEALASARADRADEYTETFKRNLDVKIAGMTEYVAVTQRQLALERVEADRRRRLLERGMEAPSAVDAALGRVASLERAIIDLQTELDRATLLRRSADTGGLLLDDGSDAAAMQRSLEDARLTLDRTRSEVMIAQQQLAAARQVYEDAQRLFDRQQSADALGRPGAIVWNHVVAEGSAVTQGSPVTTWIDCRVMLVDAAVSDAVLSLLRLGAPARVVLEGERRSRLGTVVLMRGGAATLGHSDLAAVAKGRRAGGGQVLISLDPTPADVEDCPMGRAAFVHFPDVTVLNIARARLRW